VICASSELSRLELAYVQAFQAARHEAGQGGQSVVTAKAIEHTAAVTRDCGLRQQGTIPADAVARATPCVRSSYEAQRRAFQEVLTSQEAREEARRPLERHMALQEGLRTLGHLPQNEVTDGVYGSATRRAIESFQRSVGLNASGLLSDQTEAMIDSRLRTRGR
jgi:peptidoglycan hydrolase-like protein with peptidoglycan-binding domain